MEEIKTVQLILTERAIKNGQSRSRDTSNIGHTTSQDTERRQTIEKHNTIQEIFYVICEINSVAINHCIMTTGRKLPT